MLIFAVEFLRTVKNILFGVFKQPSLLWQVIPLFFLWFALEIYFGRYTKEKLGWNTALGNGITLFWIVVGSIQFIFASKIPFNENIALFLGITIICLYSLSVIVVSFNHFLKDKWTYFFASPTIIFYFAIITLLIAHNIVILTWSSIASVFILFFLFVLFFFILRLIIPKNKKVEDENEFNSFDDKDFKEFKFKEDFNENKSNKKDLEPIDSSVPGDLENTLNDGFSNQNNDLSNDNSNGFNNSKI